MQLPERQSVETSQAEPFGAGVRVGVTVAVCVGVRVGVPEGVAVGEKGGWSLALLSLNVAVLVTLGLTLPSPLKELLDQIVRIVSR